MRIEIRGNILIVTYKDSTSSGIVEYKSCCKPNRTVLTRSSIAGFTANCGDETIKIILTGAEPIWLYFADSPIGDMRFDEAVHILEQFIVAA